MGFGFAGAHRTGKTTLAKKVAEILGFHYHDASVTKLMKEGGFNGVGDLSLDVRLQAQQFVLKRYLEELAKAPQPFLTDRTPLDMIGYMLAEVSMHSDAAHSAAIDQYVEQCVTATRKHFTGIIMVRPFGAYEADPTKPPFNTAYQTHHQLLVEGAANYVLDFCHVAGLTTSNFDERTTSSVAMLEEWMKELHEEMKLQAIH